MANYPVIEVEGIGPVYGKKLNDAGIKNTDQLLNACKTKAMRVKLAADSGIDESHILRFANMVDLFRIHVKVATGVLEAPPTFHLLESSVVVVRDLNME